MKIFGKLFLIKQPKTAHAITGAKKLEKMKPKVGTTAFHAVVWFKAKPNGDKFTLEEIRAKKNRQYFTSFDFYKTKWNETVIDHRLAFRKLEYMIEKQFAGKYISALIAFDGSENQDKEVRFYVTDKIKTMSDIIFVVAKDGGEIVYQIKEKVQVGMSARTFADPPKPFRTASDRLQHLRNPGV